MGSGDPSEPFVFVLAVPVGSRPACTPIIVPFGLVGWRRLDQEWRMA